MHRSWQLVPVVVTAMVAILASLGLAGPGRSSGSSERDSRVPYPPPVTMISDSTGAILLWAPAERERLAEGLDFRLNARACRKLVSPGCLAYDDIAPSALETVQSLGSELGYMVIVDIGYNDSPEGYGEGLDRVMRALASAGVERVIWLTLKESQDTWMQINVQIHDAAVRWPNLVVADWATLAAREPSWFADSAHMNQVGAVGFASFLRPIVLETCAAACVRPEAAATMLAPSAHGHEATLRWRGNAYARNYDVAVLRMGGAWRTISTGLDATSYLVHGVPGARMQARVRAHDESGVPGSWSQPRPFRFSRRIDYRRLGVLGDLHQDPVPIGHR